MAEPRPFEVSDPKVVVTYAENTTTHTIIVDRADSTSKGVCTFEQCDDNRITLGFEKIIGAVGHSFDIKMEMVNIEVPVQVSSRGKIVSVEKGNTHFTVDLELHNFDAREFERFMDKLSDRQDEVMRLFKAVKGA